MLTVDENPATRATPRQEQPAPQADGAAPRDRAIQQRSSKRRDRVLLVGYSPTALGGVTTVTNVLLQNIPNLDLHVALRWYGPRWKVAAFCIYSVSTFLFRLLVAAPRVVQIIVASRGDALRMLPYLVLAKLRGCRVCLHFHKNRAAIFDGFPAMIGRMVLAAWRRADAYCFLSNRLRDEYAGQFDCRKPCVVIPNPLSADWLCQDVLPAGQRSQNIVFLGRWSAEKGIEELLTVMRTLDPGLAVRCDIYSDHCPPTDPENCACHMWLSGDGVQRVLRTATLVVLPSHAEAFPTVLLEAAACGTPFVAANVAGIPDIAESSRAGILHEVGDVQGMRAAVTRLLTDRALWTDCSRNGKLWASSLEVSRVAPMWQRLYAELGLSGAESSPAAVRPEIEEIASLPPQIEESVAASRHSIEQAQLSKEE